MRNNILAFIFSVGLFIFQVGDGSATNMELPLKHAVEMGILKNRDVIVEKYLHKIALGRVFETKGIFDPILSSNLEGGKWDVPIAETFYSQGLYEEEALRG